MQGILVIDIGTSSMRGVLYDIKGCIMHIKQVLYTPMFLEGNRVEQSPQSFERALIIICKEIVDYAEQQNVEILAISLTSQRSSCMAIDEKGNALTDFIMWQDKRTADICKDLSTYDECIYKKTGLRITPVFTAPKMTWLKQNRKEVYDQAYKLIVIPDYMLYKMTGELVTDYTYGNRTLLMNMESCQWDEELLDIFDIKKEKLCQLIKQGSIAGYVTKEFFEQTGVKIGIPVITAGGDQQCAALGLGIIDDGALEVTTGTGSFVIASSNQPYLDEEKRFSCNVSAIHKKYILESSILTSSNIYRWFNERFYNQEGQYDAINKEAALSPAGANGVITFPHFQGRGTPDWNSHAKGIFFNLNLGHEKGDMARSILEGIALEIEENIQILAECIGKPNEIIVSGGLTKSDLFNQIQADVYDTKVLKNTNEESTSLGAWCQAVVATGIYNSHQEALNISEATKKYSIFTPNPATKEIYIKLQKVKKTIYEAIKNTKAYEELM